MWSDMDIASRRPLVSGTTIPILGFGTYRLPDDAEGVQIVGWALQAGYRLIDTAAMYGNERAVGEAVRRSGIPREEIFVTTKLWTSDMHRAEAAFEESFERLALPYVDLYLVHWPQGFTEKTWRAMERIYESGRARAIGVSNFTIEQIEDVLAYAKHPPVVNQIEFNYQDHDRALLSYCTEKRIVVEAYRPLGRGNLLKDPEVIERARAARETPAQFLIRWCIDQGVVPLPMTSKRDRVLENASM